MGYFTGKSVLVTGGAGFIGSHLVDALLTTDVGSVCVVDNYFLGTRENLAMASKDERLRIVDLDAVEVQGMERVLQEEKIETVFNLAVIPLPASLERPRWSSEVNIDLTLTLCELQRVGAFDELVHFSSSEAYGTAQYIPMDEGHPLLPTTPYAASKAAGDHLVHGYMLTFGLKTMTVRPFNNYGPRQNMREYAGIIPTVLNRISRDEPIILFGDGEQTRDYIYAPDTAALTLRLVECGRAWGQTINLGTGAEITIANLVKMIAKMVGTDIKVEFHPDRPGDVRRLSADVRKAETLLGEPLLLTDLETGLSATVDWYQSQLPRSGSTTVVG
jgi:UDP-glucose 4-epimerase